MSTRTADATCKFTIGSRAIMRGALAKIVWEETGWTSELRIERIRLAEGV